jgi:hypothetical protein
MDLAPIYEFRPFVSVLLKLSGVRGGSQFIDKIASFHSESLKGVTGSVRDVACGPVTYSRCIASPSRNVYSIDISMGMLRQGMTYVARDGVLGVHLACAHVEELPFENAVFDGVVCSRSLHLFPDEVLSPRNGANHETGRSSVGPDIRCEEHNNQSVIAESVLAAHF